MLRLRLEAALTDETSIRDGFAASGERASERGESHLVSQDETRRRSRLGRTCVSTANTKVPFEVSTDGGLKAPRVRTHARAYIIICVGRLGLGATEDAIPRPTIKEIPSGGSGFALRNDRFIEKPDARHRLLPSTIDIINFALRTFGTRRSRWRSCYTVSTLQPHVDIVADIIITER